MNIEEEIKNFSPNEKILIENYSGYRKKCHWICLTCGNTFELSPETLFKRKTKKVCLKCNPPLPKRARESQKNILDLVQKNPSIELLRIYTRRYTRIEFRCKECGQVNDFRWQDRRNLKCAYCQGSRHLCNMESYQYLLDKKYDKKFKILQFTSMDKRVLLKCQCGFAFTVLPVSSLRERGIKCPKCNKSRSKGELLIEKFLFENHITFESEKHFDWMAPKNRYDFFIPDKKLIIEFHGEQHYIYTPHFHETLEKWEMAKERDLVKEKQAIEHGFQYLIIPYFEQDKISSILQKFFCSTTISYESRGKSLKTQNSMVGEDIV